MAHKCKAVVITCMDFRLQKYIYDWTTERFGEKNADRGAWAGSTKNVDMTLETVELSKRLHDISTAVLINHEECGGYGEAGTPEKHAEDLRAAAAKISEQNPDVNVETYYLHLDGTFEKID
jgi:carbonic anhydrase